MCPSLEEKYNQLVPPETRDELADLEDMTGHELTLKNGSRVTIAQVDVSQNKHLYTHGGLLSRRHEASNTDDIYQ